jgi:tetratricopeptide (TPR) repeat protein
LKKAEEFLIAAYWNLLKYTSDENDKGDGKGAQEDSLVSKDEIERYRAILNKTFGKLFLHQPPTSKANATQQALDKLSQAIYLESQFHGPESIYLCSSYYYMGEVFKKEGDGNNARNFYAKIVQIWKKFITEKDLGNSLMIEDYTYTAIDRYYYEEAQEHLRVILNFFEIQFGQQDVQTAECQFTFGLVLFKNENREEALDHMEKAHITFSNVLGEFDRKTKEVEAVIKRIQMQGSSGQGHHGHH